MRLTHEVGAPCLNSDCSSSIIDEARPRAGEADADCGSGSDQFEEHQCPRQFGTSEARGRALLIIIRFLQRGGLIQEEISIAGLPARPRRAPELKTKFASREDFRGQWNKPVRCDREGEADGNLQCEDCSCIRLVRTLRHHRRKLRRVFDPGEAQHQARGPSSPTRQRQSPQRSCKRRPDHPLFPRILDSTPLALRPLNS